jgi:hypothetical protein
MLHLMENGKQAYEVYWQSHSTKTMRSGFAELALQMGPGFTVVPTFCENGEVMTAHQCSCARAAQRLMSARAASSHE